MGDHQRRTRRGNDRGGISPIAEDVPANFERGAASITTATTADMTRSTKTSSKSSGKASSTSSLPSSSSKAPASPSPSSSKNAESPDAKDSSSRRGARSTDSVGSSSGSSRRKKLNIKTSRRDKDDDDTSIMTSQVDQVLDTIPQEYLYNPQKAEPILYYVPKAVALSTNIPTGTSPKVGTTPAPSSSSSNANFPSLRLLMAAAEDDTRLHRARVQAGKNNNPSYLRTYKLELDPEWLARQQRLNERVLMLSKLETEATIIWEELCRENNSKKNKSRESSSSATSSKKSGLTQSEQAQVLLARWQRALELYVYSPNTKIDVDMLGLLEKLLEGIAEEEEMSEYLKQAADMGATLMDVTKQMVRDASDSIMQTEDAYQIRLEAHELFARHALQRTEEIQNQFRINGRAALQIGTQLEFAEAKRQRCESASTLIRRWWLLEGLAEQEAMSGEPLKVQEEVRGVIPLTSCRMDPLYTRPENSLEAAQALRLLRSVVRSRGNAAAAASKDTDQKEDDKGHITNSWGDTGKDATLAARRFDLTAKLIQRTSDALEQRLLNSFSEIYTKGGAYEFTSIMARPGVIDWHQLRELAHALLLFDSGRNLHQRYVDMVVSTRFPELFDPDSIKKSGAPDHDGSSKSLGSASRSISDEDAEFDMDATRSKLSSLFHRVSEVCMQEFQLIAYVFSTNDNKQQSSSSQSAENHSESGVATEDMPLTVARALCTRVIGDPKNGLQSRINDLLESIDRRGDFDTGAKKLDTFVVIHEKAAGLFALLRDAAERLLKRDIRSSSNSAKSSVTGTADTPNASTASANSVESLKAFLNSQETALNNSHRQGYLNLELRLLHHECCASLDQVGGCMLLRPAPIQVDQNMAEKGILEEYRAPLLPLDKDHLKRNGFNEILSGPLKQSVSRQPLIHATDSLARARLMFGSGRKGGETAARVIATIYNQMCTFYGEAFLYPIVEALTEMLRTNPPSQGPQLPFDEEQPAHDLGVDPAFWVGLERIHSAAKAYDREMWAEDRPGSNRVWDSLVSSGEGTGVSNSMSVARECRVDFFTELERRGEQAILRALDTLSAHIQWILVTGGESMLATGGTRMLSQFTGNSGGPYAIPAGSSLEAPNSPAVKSLTYCLRVQFVHIQAALTTQSLSAFWTALSMRLYDILVARLLQRYYISTVGAVIFARDVEALRSVAMLAGSQHTHWDILRELITLYMTPPDALKIMLVGPEGDINSGKGLFHRAGRDQSLVFMSRRLDYRYKSAQGQRKSGWVLQLLDELGVKDPTDGNINIGLFAAQNVKGN